MANIRQQIAFQVETYTDISALKAAVLEWASQSDMSPIALEQILVAHQSENVSYTESDWQQLEQAGFVFDENDEAMREADRQRLQNYRETGQGVPHDRVAAELSRLGAIAFMEVDVCDRFRAMAAAGDPQAGLSLLDKLDALTET